MQLELPPFVLSGQSEFSVLYTVIADVPENSFYAGFPARPHQEWLRIKANESRLPDMMKKLKLMEKRLKALEEKNN